MNQTQTQNQAPPVSEAECTRALAAMESSGFSITLKLSATEALMLLGEIQLACKHPNNKGYPRRFVETLGREIGAKLSADGGDVLRAVCDAGWEGVS